VQIKKETSEAIEKISSNTHAAENQRRVLEEKTKKERASAIQNEVITSHKKNVDIDWRWQDLEEKEDCEELAKVKHLINKVYSCCCRHIWMNNR
jgi:hypothetical protein